MASCNPAAVVPFEELRDVSPELEGQVVFSVGGAPLEVEPGTKAMPVVSSNLDAGFNVSCVKGTPGSDVSVWTSTLFEKAGSVWSGGKWWPESDQSYRFYACFPSSYPITFNSSGSTILATNSNDVCVAYCSSTNFEEVNSLEFEHIFARIEGVTIEFDPQYDSYYTLSDVSIRIVPKSGGTYNLRTKAWSSLITGSEVDLLSDSFDGLYLVPGSYHLVATWTVTGDDYEETFTDMLLSASFEAGKTYDVSLGLSGNDPNLSFDLVGEFSVASDKTVHFSRGNLWAHVASGPVNDYIYIADKWGFFKNQWDYSTQPLVVGNTISHFGWVGESSGYDSYGLCTDAMSNNTYSGSNRIYYGSSSTDELKTEWGEISGLIAACGDGWFTLNADQWNYLCKERATGGSVAGTSNVRYTLATIRTDVSGVNGMILFPDGESFAASEFSTVGTFNAASAWTTKCTAAQWTALEAKGCVFLPASGSYRGAVSGGNAESYGFYWSCTLDSDYYAYYLSFGSGSVSPKNNYYRYLRYSVRLVRWS